MITLKSVIVAFLFAISLWYLFSYHKGTCLTQSNPSVVCLTTGTCSSASAGTFVSATGGTFNPLLSIYNGQMSELEHLNTDFVASSIIGILKLLCEYYEKNETVFLELIRKGERFINFGDDESTTYDYYMLYANICEKCESKDSEDYKRVMVEANNAKERMKNN